MANVTSYCMCECVCVGRGAQQVGCSVARTKVSCQVRGIWVVGEELGSITLGFR